MRKDLDNLAYEVSKLKEEKATEVEEIARLRELAAYRERENDGQGQRLRAVDYDCVKAQERAAELGKMAEGKEFEVRRCGEAIEAIQRELA